MAKSTSAKPPKTGAPKPKKSRGRDDAKGVLTVEGVKDLVRGAVGRATQELANGHAVPGGAGGRVPCYGVPVARAEIDAIRIAIGELEARLRAQHPALHDKPGAGGPVNVVAQHNTAFAVARAFVAGAAYREWLSDEPGGTASPARAVEWFAHALLCQGIVTAEQLASAFLAKF